MIDLHAYGLIAAPTTPARTPGTLAAAIAARSDAAPDEELLIGRSARFTAGQLQAEVSRAVNVLRSLGVRPGDRLAVSLPNDTDIVVAFLAAMHLGAMWVGINRPLAPAEKVYMLADAEATVFVGDPETTAQVRAQRRELPDLEHVIEVDPSSATHQWGALLADATSDCGAPVADPFAPAAIAYTSGTTGFPKGAVHTQHNIMLPGYVAARRHVHRPGTVLGVPLPLNILNLMILGPALAFQCGVPLVVMDRVDGLGMAQWIHREGISTFSAVPAMVHDLLGHPEVTDDMLRSLDGIGVGGADMPDAFRRTYRARFGKPVGTGYGLTEAPTTVTQEDLTAAPVAGSCGKPLPQCRVEIRDTDNHIVEPGVPAEVCVTARADGEFADMYRPMLGYWKQPEASAAALLGGVLHTGDIGQLDAMGNLFILDRRNDLIIRGGANVYPAEVERVLYDVAGVSACAVVGEPDERLGQRVVAYIECTSAISVSEADIRAHCEQHLARYKVPEVIVFVDGFDRTAMGKIRKSALRDP